jgi:hypothetical protein
VKEPKVKKEEKQIEDNKHQKIGDMMNNEVNRENLKNGGG